MYYFIKPSRSHVNFTLWDEKEAKMDSPCPAAFSEIIICKAIKRKIHNTIYIYTYIYIYIVKVTHVISYT